MPDIPKPESFGNGKKSIWTTFFERLGGNLDGKGKGAMRRIPQEDLDQLKNIFDETGATARMDAVRAAGLRKAEEMGLTEEEFFDKVYNENNPKHLNH